MHQRSMNLFERLRKVLSRIYTTTNGRLPFSHTAKEISQHKIQQGRYIFQAESERHEATIMGFPSRCSLPPEKYDAVCNELIQLATTITEFEPVRMYVRPEDIQLAESLVKPVVKDASRLTLIPCPINHCWVRDMCATQQENFQPDDLHSTSVSTSGWQETRG
jgi:agmatine deiminase